MRVTKEKNGRKPSRLPSSTENRRTESDLKEESSSPRTKVANRADETTESPERTGSVSQTPVSNAPPEIVSSRGPSSSSSSTSSTTAADTAQESSSSRSSLATAARSEEINPNGLTQADLLDNLNKNRKRYEKKFGSDVVLFATLVANNLPARSKLEGTFGTRELKAAIAAAKPLMRDHLEKTQVKEGKKKVFLTAGQVEERMNEIPQSAEKASDRFLKYTGKYKNLDVFRLVGSIYELFDRS